MAIIFFVLLLLITNQIVADEELCKEKCNCKYIERMELDVDCTNRTLDNIISNWPPHNTTIKATFSHNSFPTLKHLPKTDQVVEVVFSHCNIKYLEPKLFENVPNIRFVDLSHNLLTKEEISHENFAGPNNNETLYEPLPIKHLNLAYNQIHSLPSKLFEHIQELEELILEGNDFEVLDPLTQDVIASLTKLKRLNLANNDLTELPQAAIKTLSALEEINLSRNKLDFVPYDLPLLGKTLQILILDDNPIFEIVKETFPDMTALRELYLSNLPRLDDIEEDAFTSLVSLRKLHMCNNENLIQISPKAINKSNSNLQELFLNNNSLKNINLDDFNWSQLKIFEIYDNPIECKCDLLDITRNLSTQITEHKYSPKCIDVYNVKSVAIYSIKSETCEIEFQHRMHLITKHYNMVRIALITLSVFTSLVLILFIFISYTRYRRRLLFNGFNITQVIYNPINPQHY